MDIYADDEEGREAEKYRKAPVRQLIVDDCKPTLLDTRVFSCHRIEDWMDTIHAAYPVDDGSSMECDDDDSLRRIAAQAWRQHMIAYIHRMVVAPIPSRRASMAAQLADLMLFIEMVDVAFTRNNRVLHDAMFADDSLYSGVVKLGDRYWDEFCKWRARIDHNKLQTLWWTLLCRLRYMCVRWKQPRGFLDAFETWPLARYLQNGGQQVVFSNPQTCSWYDTDGPGAQWPADTTTSSSNSKLAWPNASMPIAQYGMFNLVKLLNRLHGYWRDVTWCPNMELLVVSLWHRIHQFMFDDAPQTLAALDHPRYVSEDGQCRHNFLPYTEHILFYHLATMQTYWTLHHKAASSIAYDHVATAEEGDVSPGEMDKFFKFYKHMVGEEASFQLIQNSFRRSAFQHALLPGERDKHIEMDPTLDRRPVNILSQSRRSDLGIIAELVQDGRCVDTIHAIVHALPSAATLPPEFGSHARALYPAVMYSILTVWHTMSDAQRRSVDDTLIDRRVHALYTDSTLGLAERELHKLYHLRAKMFCQTGKKRKRDEDDTAIDQPVQPADWLWLENDDMASIEAVVPIALKLRQRYLAVQHPIVVSVRGEFWVVHKNDLCGRTRNMFQAFKWWVTRMAAIAPETFGAVADSFLVAMFSGACREAASSSNKNKKQKTR